jgi:hypothetical protein
MPNVLKKLTTCYAAGSLGGLLNGVAAWLAGRYGVTAALGVDSAPALTPQMIYHRIVWGGIWGAVLLVPLAVRPPAVRALLYSLGPTFVQLFIVFPERAGKGMMGLELGTMTPAFVVLFNFVWALTAILWLRALGQD